MQVLCTLDDLASGQGKEVQIVTPDGPRWLAVFAVEGVAVAYLNSCPHQGRSLAFAPDEFLFDDDERLICPHHGACFDTATGECTDGPCEGAYLTAVPVAVRDGLVHLQAEKGET